MTPELRDKQKRESDDMQAWFKADMMLRTMRDNQIRSYLSDLEDGDYKNELRSKLNKLKRKI